MARLDIDMFVLVSADQRQIVEDIRKHFGFKTRGDTVRACVRLCGKLLKDGAFDDAFFDSLEDAGRKIGDVGKDQNGVAKDEGRIKQDLVKKVLGKKTGRVGRPRRYCDEQIKAIREEYEEGSVTMKELARRFNCSEQTIKRIVKRESYADVEDRDWDKEMFGKERGQ